MRTTKGKGNQQQQQQEKENFRRSILNFSDYCTILKSLSLRRTKMSLIILVLLLQCIILNQSHINVNGRYTAKIVFWTFAFSIDMLNNNNNKNKGKKLHQVLAFRFVAVAVVIIIE